MRYTIRFHTIVIVPIGDKRVNKTFLATVTRVAYSCIGLRIYIYFDGGVKPLINFFKVFY